MAQPLDKEALDEALSALEGWTVEDDKLKKEFTFENFKEAMAFMVRLSYEAEKQVHHPELFNVYNTVRIGLATHDAGDKITEKDIQLAKTIESLYNK